MTGKQQALAMFRDYLRARQTAPWVARLFEELTVGQNGYFSPRQCLQRMRGIGSTWNEPHHIAGPWDNFKLMDRPLGLPRNRAQNMNQADLEALPDMTTTFRLESRVIDGRTVHVPVENGSSKVLFINADDGEFTDARDGTQWLVGHVDGCRVKRRTL